MNKELILDTLFTNFEKIFQSLISHQGFEIDMLEEYNNFFQIKNEEIVQIEEVGEKLNPLFYEKISVICENIEKEKGGDYINMYLRNIVIIERWIKSMEMILGDKEIIRKMMREISNEKKLLF
eukprot:TRINITY_DN2747_c0_g1_i1.p1 TRINITY_DN2747_c0_g1~~TRINITY_DN2747_c0_g1_i1.p1  ORF type:complete len:123 (+),score=32.71 TRINITY_DN2747_c0_g1_i1:21-389(+)